MPEQPKRKMSAVQRAFLAGAKYGYRRALRKQRVVGGMLDDERDEISATEALQQALDDDSDPETLLN